MEEKTNISVILPESLAE